jgi:flavodoxin I
MIVAMNIKIVYETQTGTTLYVAEIIQDQLRTAGHQVSLHSVKYDGNQPSLDGIELVLFGGPTYDDGKLENTLKEFISQYQPDLSKFKVAVFGLGNSTYPQFCVAADVLEEWVKSRGGQPIVKTLRVDGWPDHIEKITEYVQSILQVVGGNPKS